MCLDTGCHLRDGKEGVAAHTYSPRTVETQRQRSQESEAGLQQIKPQIYEYIKLAESLPNTHEVLGSICSII